MDHISGYKLSDAKCIVIEDILAYFKYIVLYERDRYGK